MSGSETAGGLALVKLYGIKAIAGVIAVAAGFMVLWPKSKREGIVRIASTIGGSMLGGETVLQVAYSFLPWYPKGQEAAMLIYVATGLPAWWVLGGFILWFENRKSKDLQEMVKDVKS
jgi:hypothetical protein